MHFRYWHLVPPQPPKPEKPKQPKSTCTLNCNALLFCLLLLRVSIDTPTDCSTDSPTNQVSLNLATGSPSLLPSQAESGTWPWTLFSFDSMERKGKGGAEEVPYSAALVWLSHGSFIDPSPALLLLLQLFLQLQSPSPSTTQRPQ